MKHSLSMIKYLFMNYLPIFSRWLWKYVVNISLFSQIIGSHFWWYLCSMFFFQPTKYLLSATDRVRNPPTLLQIIRKSLFFFQQCTYDSLDFFLCSPDCPKTAQDWKFILKMCLKTHLFSNLWFTLMTPLGLRQ